MKHLKTLWTDTTLTDRLLEGVCLCLVGLAILLPMTAGADSERVRSQDSKVIQQLKKISGQEVIRVSETTPLANAPRNDLTVGQPERAVQKTQRTGG